jgi:hypothetical protein
LLATGAVSDDVAARLRALAAALDPIPLLEAIRARQQRLARLASGEAVAPEPPGGDLDTFVTSLATAWQQGEVRPTHRRPARPPRHGRTHQDAFEEVWPTVRAWLEAKPEGTAKELLARLPHEHPGTFPEGPLRTLPRRGQAWRATEARRLLLSSLDEVGAVPREPTAVEP